MCPPGLPSPHLRPLKNLDDAVHARAFLCRPEDDGLFSIIVEPHATRAARQPQQQQQQQQQGSSQTSSQEPEGADRAVPSVEYHAEMQGDLGPGRNPEAAQAN